MKIIIPILFIASLLASCQHPSEATFPRLYSYRGFDSTGNLIINGSLTVSHMDTIRISGNWYFSPLAGVSDIGPQSGGGNFEGFLYDGRYRINLNPKMADNNVYLVARSEGDSLTGTWEWDGYSGLINHGTFRAARR